MKKFHFWRVLCWAGCLFWIWMFFVGVYEDMTFFDQRKLSTYSGIHLGPELKMYYISSIIPNYHYRCAGYGWDFFKIVHVRNGESRLTPLLLISRGFFARSVLPDFPRVIFEDFILHSTEISLYTIVPNLLNSSRPIAHSIFCTWMHFSPRDSGCTKTQPFLWSHSDSSSSSQYGMDHLWYMHVPAL
jgi:hypothetical protein